MRIIFIRHGKTAGNIEKRYIGSQDIPLCDIGIAEIKNKVHQNIYPDIDVLVSSPMQRCTQTAEIIYPDKELHIVENLHECNFGDFEGKTYEDLCTDINFQNMITRKGKSSFPNGETYEDFKNRCVTAFLETTEQFKNCGVLAFVIHGGTIMTTFETLCRPKKDFYDYMLGNGCGYICDFDNGILTIKNKIQ